MNKVKVSLEFYVEIYKKGDFKSDCEELVNENNKGDIPKYLEREIRDWEEGRYPFASEMLNHSLNLIAENAIPRMITQRMVAKYGNEMIKVDENTQIARYCEETSKLFVQYCFAINDEMTLKLA